MPENTVNQSPASLDSFPLDSAVKPNPAGADGRRPGRDVADALVKLSSPGQILYRAPRVGHGGRHFTFVKFRSMVHDPAARRGLDVANEIEGRVFKFRDDPRVTPLGRWLRRSSLDELPQLVNVQRGEMSLVSPRPLPARDLDPDGQSLSFSRWARLRSQAALGITGLCKISGRSNLPFERWIELDLEYVRNWSLGLDLRILLATPPAVLSGRGPYKPVAQSSFQNPERDFRV
jgi:lipopolysaccharide/colanic/teichoic acid biosynthesis glycosyltransferase